MKRFLLNILKFAVAFSILIAIKLFGILYICSFISFRIPQEKDILIVGDSHTECAINDNIFKRSVNISQSAEAYLYSYLKLRKFLNANHHINKVILSFHGGSIDISRDRWITGEVYIKDHFTKYIYLFTKDEFFFMIKNKPFLSAVIKTSAHSRDIILKLITKRDSTYADLYLGGYLWLDRDKLDEDLERAKNIEPEQHKYALYTYDYIIKIYELCKQYDVELILFNSPTYNSEIYGNKDVLLDYYNNHFSTIRYLDLSDFTLPKYGYGDINHLNYKGAEVFSKYLENNYDTIF
jgi:hypothetical protein